MSCPCACPNTSRIRFARAPSPPFSRDPKEGVLYHGRATRCPMRLIGLLTRAQQQHGYLGQDTLRELAKEANVPLHRLQQLVSFFPAFRTTPPPRVELAVCRDMSCYLRGAGECTRRLKALAGDGAEFKEVSCIGRC